MPTANQRDVCLKMETWTQERATRGVTLCEDEGGERKEEEEDDEDQEEEGWFRDTRVVDNRKDTGLPPAATAVAAAVAAAPPLSRRRISSDYGISPASRAVETRNNPLSRHSGRIASFQLTDW